MATEQLSINMDGVQGFAVDAQDLIHGSVDSIPLDAGWVRPCRFTQQQQRAFMSVLAWHPGIFRQMAQCTSGIKLEFETDSTKLSLEVRIDELPQASSLVLRDVVAIHPNLKRPFDGISVDIDGKHIGPMLPNPGELLQIILEEPHQKSKAQTPTTHTVRMWLPCLCGCDIRRVIGNGSFIRPVAAREQLLVIGDSIAQGFFSEDAAFAWPAQLADLLDMDLINQGLGGQVFQPGALMGLSSCINPTKVVVELGINYRFEACGETAISRDIRSVLSEIQESWPKAEVWVVTPTFCSEGLRPTHAKSCFHAVSDLLARAVAGKEHMQLVDGLWVMDGRIELLADHSDHPTKEGMTQIAQRLSIVISGGATQENLREVAQRTLVDEPMVAFPLLEMIRRGLGHVLFADEGCTFMRLDDGSQIIYATDRKLARRVMRELAQPTMLMVCGENIVRDAERVMGFTSAMPCHLAVYEKNEPLPQVDDKDIRVLDESYTEAILKYYTHPEYLSEGELEWLFSHDMILGGFENDELVGFIGTHPEGSIGMMEVLPGHRRSGWAQALETEMINRHLELGLVPWGEVWPGNMASLRLQEKLGLTIYPARDLTFMGNFKGEQND